jgi:hypothetical protein
VPLVPLAHVEVEDEAVEDGLGVWLSSAAAAMTISLGDDLRLRDMNGGGLESEERSVRLFFAKGLLLGEEGKDEAGGTTARPPLDAGASARRPVAPVCW